MNPNLSNLPNGTLLRDIDPEDADERELTEAEKAEILAELEREDDVGYNIT